MKIVILTVLAVFDILAEIIEVPKMLKQKLWRELVVFQVLLLAGTVFGVMKAQDLKLPSLSGFLMWVYSPFTDVLNALFKP